MGALSVPRGPSQAPSRRVPSAPWRRAGTAVGSRDDQLDVWVDGELLDADRARVSPFDTGFWSVTGSSRPSASTAGCRSRGAGTTSGSPGRRSSSASPCPIGCPARGRRCGARRQPGDGRSAADHGDRRPLPAGLGARRRSPTVIVPRVRRALGPHRMGGDGALVAHERGATAGSRPSRTPTTCARSPTRTRVTLPRRSSPTPAASCARRPGRTCSSSTTAWCAPRPPTRVACSA